MLNTIRRLPKFLKNISFWSDFIEEVDVEISNLKLELDKRKNFFNPRELDTIQSLRDLNRFFGFTIDTSLLNEYYESEPDKIIDYLRSEANNMVFKIISKGTKNYHEYLFSRIQETGYVYVNFHDEQDGILYRALNYYDSDLPMIQLELMTHDFSVGPFTKVTPLLPFPGGFVSLNNLDQGLIIDNSWTLDHSLFGMSVDMTKHISAEFMAYQTFIVGSDTLLITNDYLEYLRKSLNFARKATELPHVGLGITAYTSSANTNVFNIPTIEVDTNITVNWNNTDPKNTVYSYFKLTSDAPVTYYTQPIQDTQIFQDDNFDLINITFPVSKTNIEVIDIGDGITTDYSTSSYTADYLTIEPKTVRITYEDTSSVERLIIDDGKGHLYYPSYFNYDDFITGAVDISDFSIGTVNYTTGVIGFDTLDTRDTPGTNPIPANLENIDLSYYTTYGFALDNLIVYDETDDSVINIDFTKIILTKKEYHVSFLVVIDKRT